MTNSFSQASQSKASSFIRMTGSSNPPTIKSVGETTWRNDSPAKSGRPPRENCPDRFSYLACGHQGRAASRARSEVANSKMIQLLLPGDPMGGVYQTVGQQFYIKAKVRGVLVRFLFLGAQKIEK